MHIQKCIHGDILAGPDTWRATPKAPFRSIVLELMTGENGGLGKPGVSVFQRRRPRVMERSTS